MGNKMFTVVLSKNGAVFLNWVLKSLFQPDLSKLANPILSALSVSPAYT